MKSCLHSVGQTTKPPVCADPRTCDGDFDSVSKSVCLFSRFLPLGLPSHVLRQPPGLHLPFPHGHADQEWDLPDASVQSHASAPHPGQAGERAVLWALLSLALQPEVGAGGCRGGGSVWGGGQQPPLQLPSPHRKVGDCGDDGDGMTMVIMRVVIVMMVMVAIWWQQWWWYDDGDHEGSDCDDGDGSSMMTIMVMMMGGKGSLGSSFLTISALQQRKLISKLSWFHPDCSSFSGGGGKHGISWQLA